MTSQLPSNRNKQLSDSASVSNFYSTNTYSLLEIMMEKVKKLIEILENDLIASDFKWTLFVAAANSYKYDSLLKPFPSTFINNKTLDIFKLREVIANVPAFSVFLDELRRAAEQCSFLNVKIDEETVDLIYWCLLSSREPFLKSIDRLNVSIFLFYFI